MSATGESGSAPAARTVVLPVAGLHALRASVLELAHGEQALRDAGYAAGLALYDDFAASVRASSGAEPGDLPFPRFAAALGSYLAARGWGSATVDARASDGALRVAASDWAESEDEPVGATCHFSTGLLAGCFGRAAGRPLAVFEVACRAAGAPRCEFAIGSRETMDALWRQLTESAPNDGA